MTTAYFGKGDGLFGQYYPAKGDKATTAVVISHGIHQHSAMYVDFAHRLSAEGFDVFAYDHRGFGQSKSYGGCSRSQITEWLDLDAPSAAGDMRDAVLRARELSGVGKVYVFGHSLGGLAAGVLGTSGDSSATGYILSNPTLNWHGEPGRPAGAYQGLPFSAEAAAETKQKAGENPDEVINSFTPSNQSNSKAFVDFWGSEAISQHVEPGMPVKQAYWKGVSVDAISAVRARFGKWTAPLLLLRGGEDVGTLGVGNSGCELGSCQDLAGGAHKDAAVTLMFYPGLKHEIIFESYPAMLEPGTNIVVDDIIAWLKRQTA